MAPETSRRPKPRDPKKAAEFLEEQALRRGEGAAKRRAKEPDPSRKAAGGPVAKYAKGGMCRGMGAAKRGGQYKAM
jgi:hypothetical protein